MRRYALYEMRRAGVPIDMKWRTPCLWFNLAEACLVPIAILALDPARGLGAPTVAASLDELEQTVRKLDPGGTALLADGVFPSERPICIEAKRGTAEAPIIVRAAHQGGARITGSAGFAIKSCEHLVIEGFVLENDADKPGVLLENCRHVRVTRNLFRLRERAKPRHMEHWLYVAGDRSGENRIDHNHFFRKVNSGSPVFLRGDDEALVCSERDRVDHNHFSDVIYANGENGHETIRTGSNDLGATGRSSYSIIEYNLLERCSGETEIMSLKSSDNIVRHNTLINCRGAICLRLGNRNTVEGNFILADEGERGCGGVKLYGFDHRVVNNYLSGLTGKWHDSPLALVPGSLDTPTTENYGKKYHSQTCAAPTRAWIAFNTWVDCGPLQFGFKSDGIRVHPPNACVFANNLVMRTRPQTSPLVNLEAVRALETHGNIGYGGDAPASDPWSGWSGRSNPQLRLDAEGRGLWHLTAASPCIDAASPEGMTVAEDVFGRARANRPDIGAEEFGAGDIRRRPLTPADVGPDAR